MLTPRSEFFIALRYRIFKEAASMQVLCRMPMIWFNIDVSPSAWRKGSISSAMLLLRLGSTACSAGYLVLPPKLMMVPFYTVHVSQVLGWLPRNIKHMKNVIGPDTCLWVFVKGEPGKVYGPFFAIGTPGINLIEDGLLGQFTAQV